MSDLTPHTEVGEVQEVHAPRVREREYKKIGVTGLRAGLKLWSFDVEGNVEEVIIERSAYVDTRGKPVFHALLTEETWHFVKEHNNPKVDFKRLQRFTYAAVKVHAPHLFQ